MHPYDVNVIVNVSRCRVKRPWTIVPEVGSLNNARGQAISRIMLKVVFRLMRLMLLIGRNACGAGHYPIKNYRCCTGGPTLNYRRQLSLYVPYMLRVSMTGDLAHLQLSDLPGETRPICRTSDLQEERMLLCRT